MAKQTKAQQQWRPDQQKKVRSVKVMFASTVLSLEAFVVIFATLVAFGLQPYGTPEPVIISVGVVLSLALIGTCAFLTKPIGYPAGWILQLLIIATGFAVPMMFLVGILFALCWWYGVRTGARLDRELAERVEAQRTWESEHTGEEPEPG